ncbi:hypothetical protein K443DRAFT_678987 [Laccaria amethystina LaAM-08-1]|uniref:Uncharacterized protein n=1 Tax=Laccaria amethystina LaAM-08-1 TaxID=1095629 RepID=A0A0C9XXV2_9AGAR|nr:hypothetical protein K443DRAFT_678987 [Laccaria amethystina LaAM-08-1]
MANEADVHLTSTKRWRHQSTINGLRIKAYNRNAWPDNAGQCFKGAKKERSAFMQRRGIPLRRGHLISC